MSFAFIGGRQFYFGGIATGFFEGANCWVCADSDSLSETVDYLMRGQSPGDMPPVKGLLLRGNFSDLSSLRRLTAPIASLRFEDHKIRRRDLGDLYSLSHISELLFSVSECGLDFSAFPNLNAFVGDWHSDHKNLDRCRHLRAVWVSRLNTRQVNLQALGKDLPLDSLSIVRTNIETLEGLESFSDILSLSISYAPRLQHIGSIAAVGPTLRELEFDHAKNILDYGPVSALQKLRHLKVLDSAAIPSLSVLSGMGRLETISVAGTNVIDGNFDSLLTLPHLSAVGFDDKRHYTQKSSVLNKLLSSRQSVDIDL